MDTIDNINWLIGTLLSVVVFGFIGSMFVFASLNHLLGDRFTTKMANKLTYPLWIILGISLTYLIYGVWLG